MPPRLTRERFLSSSELGRIMDAARDRRHKHQPRDHAMIALLVGTGMRPREVLRVVRGDLKLSGDRPRVAVLRPETVTGVAAANELPLHPAVAAIVAKHCNQMDPGARLFPITSRQAERLFRYYCRTAGLAGRRTMFAVRHGIAWRLYERHRDLRVLQAVLGHRWLKTLHGYTHTAHTITLAEVAAAALEA